MAALIQGVVIICNINHLYTFITEMPFWTPLFYPTISIYSIKIMLIWASERVVMKCIENIDCFRHISQIEHINANDNHYQLVITHDYSTLCYYVLFLTNSSNIISHYLSFTLYSPRVYFLIIIRRCDMYYVCLLSSYHTCRVLPKHTKYVRKACFFCESYIEGGWGR